MSVIRESPSTAVERALEILEAVAHRNGGMTNSEVSRRLGIPKSSASYILRTLEQHGYLRRDERTGKYRLGLKLLNLTNRLLSGLDIKQVALPVLKELAERHQLTTHLAILDQGEAMYIERVEAPGFIKMDTWVGRRLPIHSTSVGKALAAYLSEATIKNVLKEQGMKRLTPKTITTHVAFRRELESIRLQGYAIDDEENNLGVRCLAAPVLDHLGGVEAAIGVSGTVSQINKDNQLKIAHAVIHAAQRISQQLGYRAAS